MRRDLYIDVSVSLWRVSSDIDFEQALQLLMSALKHTDILRVFQSGVVNFDALCVHELGEEF